jgi:hypothetical protein
MTENGKIITINHYVRELQKTVILGTAHMLRKVKGKGKAFPLQTYGAQRVLEG